MRGVRRTFLPLGELPGGGNGITSAAREWAAASEPLECKPGAAAGAVGFNGLQGVVRARRIKFAGAAEERPQSDLIGADHEAKQSRGEIRRRRGCGPIIIQVAGLGVGLAVGRGSRSSSAAASEEKSAVAAELRG